MDEVFLEQVSRRLCEIRGKDPDERIGHAHPDGLAVMMYSPRWKLCRSELLARLQIDQALKDTRYQVMLHTTGNVTDIVTRIEEGLRKHRIGFEDLHDQAYKSREELTTILINIVCDALSVDPETIGRVEAS